MDHYKSLLMKYKEDLKTISLQLEYLYDMVDIINLGLQHQRMEKEVTNCMGAIGHCINDIKNDVDQKLHIVTENNMMEQG